MTGNPPDDKPFFAPIENPEDCPYYLISRASLQITATLKRGLVHAGVVQVKPAYLGVLISLWRTDGPKAVDLGRQAGLEPSTMTGLVDRMERDGLVYRQADKDDRRAQRIFLTDEGRHVRRPVLKATTTVLSKVFDGISQEELLQVMTLLQQVLKNAGEGRK